MGSGRHDARLRKGLGCQSDEQMSIAAPTAFEGTQRSLPGHCRDGSTMLALFSLSNLTRLRSFCLQTGLMPRRISNHCRQAAAPHRLVAKIQCCSGLAEGGKQRGRQIPRRAAIAVDIDAPVAMMARPASPISDAAAIACAAWYPAMAAGIANASPTPKRNSGDRITAFSNCPMMIVAVAAAKPASADATSPPPA